MNRLLYFAVAAVAAVHPAPGGETRTWQQGTFDDFQKGVAKNLSVRSDGLLTLAPRSREVLDTASPYLWALARDSKGNLYAGGGTGAKLHRLSAAGKSEVVAELEGLEIHAIVIDRSDRVYAATSPDGKVYRITPGSKPEVFFDPKAKYIWAMAFNSTGDLYIATGDQGEVFRVNPAGQGKMFFRTDETHARSLAIDAKDNLVLGTEPGGLVLRVSPAGDGFVLYQMARKEVTAVAVAADGTIYAAAVGTKQPAGSGGGAGTVQATPLPPQIAIAPQGGAAVAVRPTPPPAAALPSLAAQAVTGGSQVYRIEPNGNPRRIWSNAQDVVYAIALDAQGRPLLGTGNKGNVYRVESPTRYTALLNVTCTQVTALESARDGRIFAATGNVGKVYEFGPGLEREGSLESDVYDSGVYSAWGRLSFEGRLDGGQIAIAARSGNLDTPRKNWSPWSAAVTSPKGDRITAPAARFVQWRANLQADSAGHSPELELVEVAYLPKNLEPRVDEIEITPPNYKFPAPSVPSASPATLSLPAIGRHTAPSVATDSTSAPSLTYARGIMSARWAASDPNGDTLVYTVRIRGENEKTWKPLKEKVKEKHLSWDATAFPDGEYRLQVSVSDAPSNPPAEALTAEMESDVFLIDNTPPRITQLTAARNGTSVEVHWHAADALNNLKKAEYSLDGGDWTVVAPVTRLSDSLELDYAVTIDAVAAGEHTVAVRVQDDYDNLATEKVQVK